MFSYHKVDEKSGLANRIPSKNPNTTNTYDIQEEAVYDNAQDKLAVERESNQFDMRKLGFKSIFDTVPDTVGLPSVTAGVKQGLSAGETIGFGKRNPNYTTAEDINYQAQNDKATQDIIKMSAINRALQDKNYPLAEMLLGRPITQDDLKVVTSGVFYKSNAPQGVIYKSFDVRDVVSLQSYLKSLENSGIPFKMRTSGNEVFIISGLEVTPDPVKTTTTTSSDSEEPPLYKDVWEFLKDKNINVPSDISLNLRRPDLIQVANALGIEIKSTDNVPLLKNKIKKYLFTDNPHLLKNFVNPKNLDKSIDTSSSSSKDEEPDEKETIDISFTPTKTPNKNKPSHTPARKKKTKKIFPDVPPTVTTRGEEVSHTPNPAPITSGNGLARKSLIYTMTDKNLRKQLELTTGMLIAGNDSPDLKEDLGYIMQAMYDRGILSALKMKRLTQTFLGKI